MSFIQQVGTNQTAASLKNEQEAYELTPEMKKTHTYLLEQLQLQKITNFKVSKSANDFTVSFIKDGQTLEVPVSFDPNSKLYKWRNGNPHVDPMDTLIDSIKHHSVKH